MLREGTGKKRPFNSANVRSCGQPWDAKAPWQQGQNWLTPGIIRSFAQSQTVRKKQRRGPGSLAIGLNTKLNTIPRSLVMCEFTSIQKESFEISCPHTQNRSYGKAPEDKTLQWFAWRHRGQEMPGMASCTWILTVGAAHALSFRGWLM